MLGIVLILSLINIVFSISNLDVFVNEDSSNFYSYETIYFYVNFTNQSNELTYGINANCYINISTISTSYENMFFNESNNLYEYNHTFQLGGNYPYTIICNSSLLNISNTSYNSLFILPNSKLIGFDSTNDSSFFTRKFKNINFYANYSSILRNFSISNGVCNISFSDLNFTMNYNQSLNLFELNRSFNSSGIKDYKIICNDNNFSKSIFTNSIEITPLFEKTNFDFLNLKDSSIILSDFNNNEVKEIGISGIDDNSNIQFIFYEYQENSFNQLNLNVSGFIYGDMKSADLNNDGLEDLITCGENESGNAQTNLYFNNGTNLVLQNQNLENLKYCAIDIGDIDNDGDYDIAISGTPTDLASQGNILIYENLNSKFINKENISTLAYGDVMFLDINQDYYLDLIYSGKDGDGDWNSISKIYLNNNNNTFIFDLNLNGLSQSKIKILNNNLLICSGVNFFNTVETSQTKIYSYKNPIINEIQSLNGFYYGSISVGDIDNNGLEDLILTGINQEDNTQIYCNNKTKYNLDNLYLDSFKKSSSILFDYDNDQDLDLIISGEVNGDTQTTLYENTISNDFENANPTKPDKLNVTFNNQKNQLEFNWSSGSDDLTNTSNLYYNLQIGTINNNYSVLSPNSQGNMLDRNSYFLNIKPGNYNIKIQTIDNSHKKSNWLEIETNYCDYSGTGDWVIDGYCILKENITMDTNGSIILINDSLLKLINSNIEFNGIGSSIIILNGTLTLNNSIVNSNNQINLNVSQNSAINIINSTLNNLNININSNNTIINKSKIENSILNFNQLKINIFDSNFLTSDLALKTSNINLINTNYSNYNLDLNSNLNIYYNLHLLFNTNNVLMKYWPTFFPQLNNSILIGNNNLQLNLLTEKINSTNSTIYSNYSFLFTKSKYIDYNLNININDNINRIINLIETSEPDYTEFSNSNLTTNFTELFKNNNLNIQNAIIANLNNYINFTSLINYAGINLSDAIEIKNKSIFVNSENYSILNTSAQLVFNNLNYKKTPAIFKDGKNCISCQNISYDSVSGKLSFNVNSFSNYSISENSKISWIDKNLICNLKNSNSLISIAYLNHSNNPIQNSSCYINISNFNNLKLDYNLLDNIFIFNKTLNSGNYNFSVYCNTTQDYENLIYNNQIYIKKDIYDIQFTKKDFELENVYSGSNLFFENNFLLVGSTLLEENRVQSYYSYINNNFEKIENNFSIESNLLSAFDYDNDGDLDLIYQGNINENKILVIAENQTNRFNLKNIWNISFKLNSLDIIDYDNDGDLDFVILGRNSSNKPQIFIFKNNNGIFEQKNFSIIKLESGTVLFFDYNNDGFQDLIINGLNNISKAQTLIYKNINGTNFILDSNISNKLVNTIDSSLATGDFNNDNLIDLLIDGRNENNQLFTNLYQPENNSFKLNQTLDKTYSGSNLFADFDLNGNVDLFQSGNYLSQILLDSINSTNNIKFNNLALTSIATNDYDNDGDLDFIISGLNSSGQAETSFYENDANICIQNSPPTVPRIEAKYNESTNKLYLNWSESTDAQGGSVTYNIRIGNYYNSNAVLTGIVTKTTKPNNPGMGNMRYRRNITLNIPKQCFKIQIQAIDNSYLSSNWSNIQQLAFTEIKGNNYDENCDGVIESADGGSAETSSSSSSSSSIDVKRNEIETLKSINEETTETQDKSTQSEIIDQNEQKITQTNENSEFSSSSNSQYSIDKSLNKIYELKNVLGHTRKISYQNEHTLIREEIKNKFLFSIKDIELEINIPKTIIKSASKDINWYKSSRSLKIVQDDPILSFKIEELQPGERYYLEYELNEEFSPEDINLILVNISYDEASTEQKDEIEKLLDETKKHLNITQTYETDFEQNTTKYTLDLDFKNESILYNVSIYQEIPKCLIQYLNQNFIDSNYDFEIVDEDPLIVWHFDEISKNDKIEFAIKSVADDDCNDQSQTFAIAKSIFILNKKLELWPYKSEETGWMPGIILSSIILFILTIILFNFVSFTQTKNDKLRLANFMEKFKFYKKQYHLSNLAIKNNLISDGATKEEINEIFTKNVFRRLFFYFEIAFEELLLFLFIIINVFDFLEILPGDFDLIKKFISWTFLSYLFYQISITKILFGVRKRWIDISILFAFYLLILKNFIVYAVGAVQEMHYFVDFMILIVRDSENIQKILFVVGLLLVLINTIILTIKIKIQSPSVLGLLRFNFNRRYIIKFFIIYTALMLFFTTIYNFAFEWLAIAIDAPLVTVCILAYFVILVKRHERFNFNKFLSTLSNELNTFYGEIINLFTKRNLFILGVSAFLILNILTEIGNFILPYIFGQADSLYFGATIADYSKSTFLQLLETGHAAIFSLKDFFSNNINSIFIYQINNLDSWIQALNLFINYIFNIVFVVLLMVMPAIIWYHIYKYKKQTNSNSVIKVRFSQSLLAIFIFSATIFFMNPAFNVGFIEKSDSTNILVQDDLVKGIDVQTQEIPIDIGFKPIIYGVILSLLAYLPGRGKHMINNIISLLVLMAFSMYIVAFYYQLQIYYFDIIKTSLANLTAVSSYILINLALMYLFTTIFYIGGLLLFIYELWKDDEIPFEDEFDHKEFNNEKYLIKKIK